MSATTGPFEILEVLGDGAFGAVFVARRADDPLKRLVAIKVLKAEYVSNPKVLHRTRDEARLLSKLHHPNIVRVEQLVEVNGRPVLVMELVQGVSLKRLLARHPDGLPAHVAMECMRQTCVALHAAYSETFGEDGRPLRAIHRDIKPSNMLLSIHGVLKVVDFGIATGQFQEREAQTESVVMGSRPYMAPERLDGASDTPAVDIYSAGMTLLELLTGRVANLSINPTHHARALAEAMTEVSPDGLTPELREELRQLIRRMCAYDIKERPTARDAAAALDRLCGALDPAHRVTLEQFAREAVEPLFLGRKRRPLDESIDELADSELITGVFAAPSANGGLRHLGRQPAVFLGAVAGMLIGSLGLAVEKAWQRGGGHTEEAAWVRVWMPSDAQARLGAHALVSPGRVEVDPGARTLQLLFNDGRVLSCPFEARTGTTVRFVVDQGRPSVSVDDGPATPCVDGAP